MKCCFGVKHIFGKLIVELYFPKKCHSVTLNIYMIIYEKCIIFYIACGEMYELLA